MLQSSMARKHSVPPTSRMTSTFDSASMSADEIAAANLERSPSEQLTTTPRCGARVTNVRPSLTPEQAADIKERRAAARAEGIPRTDPRHPDYHDPTLPLPEPGSCKQPAGYGTDHVGFGYCKFHGGNTPAGKKAGAKAAGRALIAQHRQEIINAERAGGHREAPQNQITPELALLEEVRRSVAMVRWIEERIGMWNIADLSELEDRPSGGGGELDLAGLPALTTETFKGTPMATDAHSWLILYREERGHMIRVSKLAIDSGIQERMVRIAEQQGQMLTLAIRAVLTSLNLTPTQADMVPTIVPEILRQVASGLPQITVNGEVVA